MKKSKEVEEHLWNDHGNEKNQKEEKSSEGFIKYDHPQVDLDNSVPTW